MLASETDKHWCKGYVSGTFDMFHIGHLNLLRRTKERCDYLVVGVLSDEVVLKYKGKKPIIPLDQRMEIVGAIRYVDEVDITTEELLDKAKAWEKYNFNAMFSGDDHKSNDWLKESEKIEFDKNGVDIAFFPYTKEITSTMLREMAL